MLIRHASRAGQQENRLSRLLLAGTILNSVKWYRVKGKITLYHGYVIDLHKTNTNVDCILAIVKRTKSPTHFLQI